MYKLILSVPADYTPSNYISVKINTNVPEATLNINGETLTTCDGKFVLRLEEGVYPYTLSTNTKGFEGIKGNLQITNEDVTVMGRRDCWLEMPSEKKCNLHITFVGDASLIIDSSEISRKTKELNLSMGTHTAEIMQGSHTRKVKLELSKPHEYLNADIRVPLTIVSPLKGEFKIEPLHGALKPSVSKFKANQTVYGLGRYLITAKCKGYDPVKKEIILTPEMPAQTLMVSMVSNAGKLYYGLEGVERNKQKGIKEFEKLISRGDEVAAFEYGSILFTNGSKKEAEGYIRMSFNSGYPPAALFMARNFATNRNDSIHYAKVAISLGAAEGHQILGDVYYNQDKSGAVNAFKEYSLYDSDHSRTRRVLLGIEYPELGLISYPESCDLLDRIKTNSELYNEAVFLKGLLLYSGVGVQKNSIAAIALWNKLPPECLHGTDINLIMTAHHLGSKQLLKYIPYISLNKVNNANANYNGVNVLQLLVAISQQLDQQDSTDAFKFLKKAYDLGDRSLITLSYLGKYYKDGDGTVKDTQKAKVLFEQAIENYKDVKSMRWLGNIYENEKDFAKAESLYRQAIALNDTIAQGYLGTLLFNKGKSYHTQAVKLWTAAAEAGHSQSITNLIKYYERIAKNPAKANYWRSKL